MALALRFLGLPQVAMAQETPAEDAATAPDFGLSGAYLAARVAESDNDFRAAAGWYDAARAADPGNPVLVEGALYSRLMLGNFDQAKELALALGDKAADNQLAGFALTAADALAEDYPALIKAGADGRKVGPVLDELVMAWAKVGNGQMSEALADFDAVVRAARNGKRWASITRRWRWPLRVILRAQRRSCRARPMAPVNLNRRGIIALAQILVQLERNADAVALLDRAFGTEPEPTVDALRARLQAGEPVPFDMIPSAKAGIAEVFYTVGSLAGGRVRCGLCASAQPDRQCAGPGQFRSDPADRPRAGRSAPV